MYGGYRGGKVGSAAVFESLRVNVLDGLRFINGHAVMVFFERRRNVVSGRVAMDFVAGDVGFSVLFENGDSADGIVSVEDFFGLCSNAGRYVP